MRKQVFPMLSTWEMPSFLADMTKEGHVSNEGEVLLLRVYDVLSQLTTRRHVTNHSAPAGNDMWRAAGGDKAFDRKDVSSDELKRRWEMEERMHALQKSVDGSSGNGASGKYASTEESSGRHGGGVSSNRTYQAQLKNPYIRKNNIIDVLPEEAMYTMEKLMLATTDRHKAEDFIKQLVECSRNRQTAALQSIVHLLQAEREVFDITTQRQVRTAMQMHVGSARGRPLLVREPIFQLVPGV